MKSSLHLGLRSICHVCLLDLHPKDLVIALLSDLTSNLYNGRTLPFLFPPLGPCLSYALKDDQSYITCRKPRCTMCAKSPEAFVVHTDCLTLFESKGKEMMQLWTLAAWNRPWATFPNLYLPAPVDMDGEVLLETDIPQLSRIPLEILHLIRKYSANATFWRYLTVLSLVKRLYTTSQNSLLALPTSQLSSWERGKPPSTMSSIEAVPRVLRICIDKKGARSLEQVSESSGVMHGKTNAVYIVEKEEAFADIFWEFKDNLMRFRLPTGHTGFLVWDTPYPLDLGSCQFHPRPPAASQYIRTIHLKQTSGLTFFLNNGRVYGIHTHTSYEPSAASTFRTFPKKLQASLIWIYLPLPQGQIQSFRIQIQHSLRLKFNLLIQATNLYTIGQWNPSLTGDTVVNVGPIEKMLYQQPETGQSIAIFGVQPTSVPEALPLPPQPRASTRCPDGASSDDVYYSYSALENVVLAVIFYKNDSRNCSGILFRYKDGTQGAVGQCGIESFREKKVLFPSRMYYKFVQMQQVVDVEVDFIAECTEDDTIWRDWKAKSMSGVLAFWCNCSSTILAVEESLLYK